MGKVEIKAKVINKHDAEANWNSHPSFIPDESEIIIYDKDDNYNYPRIKIGDGVTNIASLPFIDANTLTNINNLQTQINNVEASTSDEAINTKINTAIQDIGALTIDLNNTESGTVPYTNSDMLGGIPASDYALKTDTAPNSSQLGGIAASEYALKTDTATDSAKLDGQVASYYATASALSSLTKRVEELEAIPNANGVSY